MPLNLPWLTRLQQSLSTNEKSEYALLEQRSPLPTGTPSPSSRDEDDQDAYHRYTGTSSTPGNTQRRLPRTRVLIIGSVVLLVILGAGGYKRQMGGAGDGVDPSLTGTGLDLTIPGVVEEPAWDEGTRPTDSEPPLFSDDPTPPTLPITPPADTPHEDSTILAGDVEEEVSPAVVDGEDIVAAEADKTISATPSDASRSNEKYIVVAALREQESTSSKHLYQVSLLALLLNRTLVIPTVSGARIGACQTRAFTTWYTADALDQLGARTISQHDFRVEMARRGGKVPTRGISFKQGRVQNPVPKVSFDSSEKGTQAFVERWCLDTSFGDLLAIGAAGLSTTEILGRSKTDDAIQMGRSLVRLFEKPQKDPSGPVDLNAAEVLAIYWEPHYPVFSFQKTPVPLDNVPLLTPPPSSESFIHLKYSPALHALADRVIDSLGGAEGIVAVHWRTETVPEENLMGCGQRLVEFMKEVNEEKAYKYFWMASDYPFEALLASKTPSSTHSGTYALNKGSSQHKAMSKFLSTYQAPGLELPQFTSLALHGPTLGMDIDKMDRGTFGILVKLIASRAGRFLAGAHDGEGRCGRFSLFTEAIESLRSERLGKGHGEVVDYWQR